MDRSCSVTLSAITLEATDGRGADIVIESSAGTDPITSHGHRKADAKRIRDLIESFQTGGSAR